MVFLIFQCHVGIEYFNTAILDSSIYSLASWEDLIISVDVIAPTEDPILDHAGIIVCTKWKDGSHVYTSLEDGKLKFPVKMVCLLRGSHYYTVYH